MKKLIEKTDSYSYFDDNTHVLKNVKIYGFDPTIKDNYGYHTVALYINEEQKNHIDSYIYGKCNMTKDGEIIFYGKNKQHPIQVLDADKNKIEKPINEVFFADVSILIDVFTPKPIDGIEQEPKRYSKCLGIKYICPVANEQPKIVVQNKFETFDEIFGDDTAQPATTPDFSAMKTKEEIASGQSQYISEPPMATQPMATDPSIFEPTVGQTDDLPF